MRVLLVAPRSDLLQVDAEIEDILRSGLDVDPLLGNVSTSVLLRRIKAGNYDVLWLAAHGNADGVQLSDGLLSASELVPQVRERFRLVVLNSCSSLAVAQLLQEEANVGVIATLVDVPDRQAYQTGSLLASALAAGADVAAAYLRSKPGGNRLYLYLPALAPASDALASLTIEIRTLRVQLENEAADLRRYTSVALWLAVASLALHGVNWLIAWLVWSALAGG